MSGFASALELSAKIVRDNLADPSKARLLISEMRKDVGAEASSCRKRGEPNKYLEGMELGYAAVLSALYEMASR